MVTVEEIDITEPEMTPPSKEKLLDAEEIEKAAATITRPTARMHLEALAKKLRKDSEALKRVEQSKMQTENQEESSNKMETTTSSSTPAPVRPTPPPAVSETLKYVSIDKFAFDAGGYDSKFVTLYISLLGVGSIDRSNITCNFNPSSFDFIVRNLNGKSYRLFKDNLENDIDTDSSKIVVKADKVLVKLAKKKKEYGGYDYWSKLSDPKKRSQDKKSKDDPQRSIMDLMKNMYEEGDDNMKKVIGETMMKQQRGELGKGDNLTGMDLDMDKDF